MMIMKKKEIGKLHSNKGFTLVELVIVLIILSLMAAIITPALLGYIDSSRREREITNAKAVLNALNNKLAVLYDQGIMPNQEFHGEINNGTDGFHWREDWTDDVLYSAGITDRPYICGYFTGNLTKDAGTGNYLGNGLSGLKKGYKVYAMVYVEKADSDPVVFYDDTWDRTTLVGVMDLEGGSNIVLRNGESIFRSRMCTLFNCTGDPDNKGNAIDTYKEIRVRYKVSP